MVPHSPSEPDFAPVDISASLNATLEMTGFNPADFDLVPDIAVRRAGYDMPDRLFRVRRKSTGLVQLYSVAPGSPWLFNAYADLVAGRFGPPDGRVPSRRLVRPS